MSKPIKAKDCCNLAKEYNGESNWCLLRDAHCHLLVKHERYSFDKKDITCGYLDALDVSKQGTTKSFRNCGECGQRFKGVGRAKYCGDVCKRVAKKKSNRKSYANQENNL